MATYSGGGEQRNDADRVNFLRVRCAMLHDDEAIVAADGAVRRLSGPLFTEIAEAAMGEKVDEVMLLALTHREEPSAMELVGLGIFNLARYVIKYFQSIFSLYSV